MNKTVSFQIEVCSRSPYPIVHHVQNGATFLSMKIDNLTSCCPLSLGRAEEDSNWLRRVSWGNMELLYDKLERLI